MVSKVSQMCARSQRCTVPTRQSISFLRTPRSAAKTNIPSEMVPKIRPSGVPPTLRCSDGFWTRAWGNCNPLGRIWEWKLPT